MNFAYFRKSKFSLEKTIENVKKNAEISKWKILGEALLPKNAGKMILICRPEWVETIVKENYNLLGFLPCAITVFKKNNDVLIGTGQPAVIRALAQSGDIAKLASQAEENIKKLIHESAGVEELKPKNIKLYSTTTCPYCVMEKSWLDSKKVKYDLVYVDLNPKEAEIMVEKTGQMGVPVTEIQYEGSESEFIVGFDKEKIASLLFTS